MRLALRRNFTAVSNDSVVLSLKVWRRLSTCRSNTSSRMDGTPCCGWLLSPESNTGSLNSLAMAILSAGKPLKPNDLQKITIDPALTPYSAANSEMEWETNCSGSSRTASAIRRWARLRLGSMPWSSGISAVLGLRVPRQLPDCIVVLLSSASRFSLRSRTTSRVSGYADAKFCRLGQRSVSVQQEEHF